MKQINNGISVLSLFDGLGAAYLALQRAGIPVDRYFSSEICPYAISVLESQNIPAIHLGDVKQIAGRDFNDIDLLIGGSPCQGFSLIGKQLNLDDERSVLILEYIRLLKEVQPAYWLLENVKMNQQSKDFISDQMGVEPVKLNSSLVSCQNRERLYWTNMTIPDIKDRNITASSLLKDTDYKPATLRKATSRLPRRVVPPNGDKFGCLTTSYYKGINGDGRPAKATKFGAYPHETDITSLTPEECEQLQTLPIGHTSVLSKTQRYKTIGNSFTVEIIREILEHNF